MARWSAARSACSSMPGCTSRALSQAANPRLQKRSELGEKHAGHPISCERPVQWQDRFRDRWRQRYQSRSSEELRGLGRQCGDLRPHPGKAERSGGRALCAKVCAVAADVREFGALEKAFARSAAELGPMDVLVCGAAGNFLVPAEKLSPNGFKTVIDIDLLGAFNASRAAFEQLKETQGTIIYISAGMAYMPYAFQVHVGAAKAGIDMLMRNLALESGRYGIRTNSIVPRPIEGTEGMKRLWSAERQDEFGNAIPLRRIGTVYGI